jgi:hypothetical protein
MVAEAAIFMQGSAAADACPGNRAMVEVALRRAPCGCASRVARRGCGAAAHSGRRGAPPSTCAQRRRRELRRCGAAGTQARAGEHPARPPRSRPACRLSAPGAVGHYPTSARQSALASVPDTYPRHPDRRLGAVDGSSSCAPSWAQIIHWWELRVPRLVGTASSPGRRDRQLWLIRATASAGSRVLPAAIFCMGRCLGGSGHRLWAMPVSAEAGLVASWAVCRAEW